MTETVKLLCELTRQGIELKAHGDHLRFRPRSNVGPELVEKIKHHKAELLTILAERTPESPSERDTAPAIPSSDDKIDAAAWPDGRPDWVEDVMADPGPGCPTETPAPPPVETPDGWTPTRWAARLRQLADACESTNPKRAAELRACISTKRGVY